MQIPSCKGSIIPIVAFSANMFQEDIDKSLAAEMSGRLGKPIDIDALIGVLKKHLS